MYWLFSLCLCSLLRELPKPHKIIVPWRRFWMEEQFPYNICRFYTWKLVKRKRIMNPHKWTVRRPAFKWFSINSFAIREVLFLFPVTSFHKILQEIISTVQVLKWITPSVITPTKIAFYSRGWIKRGCSTPMLLRLKPLITSNYKQTNVLKHPTKGF